MFFDSSVLSRRLLSALPFVLVSALLSGCSSNDAAHSKPTKPQQEQNQSIANTPSGRAQMQSGYEQSSPQEQAIEQAYYAMERNAPTAELAQMVSQLDPDVFVSIDADIKLASVYLYLEQTEQADIIITRLKRGALPTKYQIPLWFISAQLDAAKGEHLNSIRTLFRLSQLYGAHLSEYDKTLNNELIWQNILALSASSLYVFESDFGAEVDSWIQLAQLLEGFPFNPTRFSQQLQNWARAHSSYAQPQLLPKQIAALANTQAFAPKTLALVLPFSGKLAKQAEAIRNGFFANADLNDSTQYLLLDSNKLSIEQIEQAVIAQNVDFIVGPLMKETISQFEQSAVLSKISQLSLNTLDKERNQTEPALTNGLSDLKEDTETGTATANTNNHFYFALSPEDEITQAVNYFINKGVDKPAIIYADNSLGRRLSQQFNQQWLQHTDEDVERIAFDNMAKLNIAVKDLLDVGLSEKRIEQIEKLFGAKIKSEKRSRIDIDAIYVIANSQQTRLIKPFFDVNVSRFGNGLPIYASSRSYLIGETRSEKLDLNGLTFTEMPWLLKESQDAMSRLYQQVGDNNTQLKKLFAFGHDAFRLIPVVKHLALLPEIHIPALTGELSVQAENTVTRALKWAQYKQGKVIVLKTINQ